MAHYINYLMVNNQRKNFSNLYQINTITQVLYLAFQVHLQIMLETSCVFYPISVFHTS
jgi:hypothetical protein